MKDEKKQFSWKRVALIALCVILSLILVVLIFAAVFMDRILGSINRAPDSHETLSSSELQELLEPVETRGEDFTGPTFNAEDITIPTEVVEIVPQKHVVNILLLGQDRRGGTKNSMTDVMMLCTIDKETKTLTMTSFLRDLYVKIPGHYRNDKMNIAYAVGGFPMINDTLETNFGVKVDGNVEVDFSQFAKIIDMLGGIDIELTGAEAAYLNNGWATGMKSGMNRLSGSDALAYARIRDIDSDFQRTNRQRNVVTAILNQFRNASLTQLTDTLTTALGMITTNMTDAEIMKYALEFAPILKDLKIVSQHIPVEGSYYYGDVKDQNIVDCIFIKDYDANLQLIADAINGQ